MLCPGSWTPHPKSQSSHSLGWVRRPHPATAANLLSPRYARAQISCPQLWARLRASPGDCPPQVPCSSHSAHPGPFWDILAQVTRSCVTSGGLLPSSASRGAILGAYSGMHGINLIPSTPDTGWRGAGTVAGFRLPFWLAISPYITASVSSSGAI